MREEQRRYPVSGPAKKIGRERAPNANDPVAAAAGLMVDRLLKDLPPDVHEVRGVALVVEVPGSAWVEPVSEALLAKLLPQVAKEADETNGAFFARQPTAWVACQQTVQGRTDPRYDPLDVGWQLSTGRNVLGVSASPKRQLPPDLLRATDWHLTVPSIDARLATELAKRLTGKRPRKSLPEVWCRLIGPEDLRLARRPGEGADQFIDRLRRLVEPKLSNVGITLDDLHGMEATVAWGKALVADIADFQAGRLAWSAVDKGVLLTGPPGTGKTTFAQALAQTCGVPLIAGSFARWQAAGHLGDLLKAMRLTFDQARRAAPSILFIDEADSFGDRATFRHEYRDYSIQVVNGLLEELDGVAGREGVVVVGACNTVDRIDPAIIRSGRLDLVVNIPLPNQPALAGILRHYLGQDLPGADLTMPATLAIGHTGADCERWVRAARRRARSASRAMVMDDLTAEIRGATPVRPTEVLHRCAVHEAGHAVALALLCPGKLIGATVRQSLSNGGGVLATPDDEVMTREDVLMRIRILLAGRAAEELLLGSVSTGAGGNEESDLAKATMLAVSLSTAFGMDEQRGLVWMGFPSADTVDVQLRWQPDIQRRVADLLAQEYAQVLELLRGHQSTVQHIADELVSRETISGPEIEAVVVQAAPMDGRRRAVRPTPAPSPSREPKRPIQEAP